MTLWYTPHPDGLRARAVLKADDRERLTFVRTADTRSALARGLKEYLEEQRAEAEGGRELRFESVGVAWAEPEQPAKLPAATLVGGQDATYDDAGFSVRLRAVDDGSGRYVRHVTEVRQVFQLVVWSTDPLQRSGLVALLEDALNPAEFMSGLRLELPFYFGARATYEPVSVGFDDQAADAQRRWRRAIITLNAHVPQYRPVGDLPRMRLHLAEETRDG